METSRVIGRRFKTEKPKSLDDILDDIGDLQNVLIDVTQDIYPSEITDPQKVSVWTWFETWGPDHHHWYYPSWVALHKDGTIQIYMDKIANMKRTNPISNHGKEKAFGITIHFYGTERDINSAPDFSFSVPAFEFISFHTEKVKIYHEVSYPQLVPWIENSPQIAFNRWIAEKNVPSPVVIPFPQVGF